MESMVFVLPTALLTSSNQAIFILQLFFFSLKYSIPGKKKLSSKACASAVSLNKFCLDDPRDSWRFFSSGPWLQDCPFLVSSHRSCTHKDIPRVNRLLSLQLNNVTQNREM